MDQPDHAPDGGFALDMPRLLPRRQVLSLIGAAGASVLGSSAAAQVVCPMPAMETPGPFPGDGTNRRSGQVINVLTEGGVVREDLRPSFAGQGGTADGVPMRLTVAIVSADGCTPLPGAALYIWHCDAAGRYSLYDLPDRNYLRGLGIADAAGKLRFTTIVPGCYAGRWPHFHFEVFADAAAATNGRAARLTSQFALPEAPIKKTYRASRAYSRSVSNLERTSFARDVVFRDNSDGEMEAMMLTLTGAPEQGYLCDVTVPLG
ncbi:hypothetical protein DEA8626_01188 [Defluviimonas aquaemixtae]|uniref:Intradiol ring-cleavage dioxygenases domain-containing protein n=1 Tax=Albidovulum aquaemixtae TaxID=1542388 RepID=A0A2R8B4V1_9RHOB|nr:intradiol ring-cleavage dioxygenase [Defluviimonas aquaemixtae]SPH17664.1 hypothetical protein DEA8626_01188 [Defluviimonas aquaemixtae]